MRHPNETNPWLQLPAEPPYVLPADRPFVDRFNERARDRHRIRLEIIPEPYLGNPDAPVVLLNLNPGFVDDDRGLLLEPPFNDAARANLEHRHPECCNVQNPTISPGNLSNFDRVAEAVGGRAPSAR